MQVYLKNTFLHFYIPWKRQIVVNGRNHPHTTPPFSGLTPPWNDEAFLGHTEFHCHVLSSHHPPCVSHSCAQQPQFPQSAWPHFPPTERRLDVGPGARGSTSKYLMANTSPSWLLIAQYMWEREIMWSLYRILIFSLQTALCVPYF